VLIHSGHNSVRLMEAHAVEVVGTRPLRMEPIRTLALSPFLHVLRRRRAK
jgi:hypothetical protein